ncbi:hypothetical protein CCP3SC1_680014 [Gammaproteobacteria bacterium]
MRLRCPAELGRGFPIRSNKLKGTSSRFLRIERPDIVKRYHKDVLWSPSYFAVSAGGAPLDVIKQYVEDQRNH